MLCICTMHCALHYALHCALHCALHTPQPAERAGSRCGTPWNHTEYAELSEHLRPFRTPKDKNKPKAPTKGGFSVYAGT